MLLSKSVFFWLWDSSLDQFCRMAHILNQVAFFIWQPFMWRISEETMFVKWKSSEESGRRAAHASPSGWTGNWIWYHSNSSESRTDAVCLLVPAWDFECFRTSSVLKSFFEELLCLLKALCVRSHSCWLVIVWRQAVISGDSQWHVDFGERGSWSLCPQPSQVHCELRSWLVRVSCSKLGEFNVDLVWCPGCLGLIIILLGLVSQGFCRILKLKFKTFKDPCIYSVYRCISIN